MDIESELRVTSALNCLAHSLGVPGRTELLDDDLVGGVRGVRQTVDDV
jgi:hypothetical protein